MILITFYYVLNFLFIQSIYCSTITSINLFGSLIRRRFVESKNDEPNLTFDSLGKISAVEDAIESIKQASPIVILRSSNSTVLSFISNDPSSLHIPLVKSFNRLHSKSLYLLITGISGDCRMVIKQAKVLSLNSTVEFSGQPRGLYIAKNLAEFLQDFTFNSNRPLCCKLYLIDLKNHQLFQINTSGILTEVRGGVAGIGMESAEEHLDANYNNNLSEERTKHLVNETMDIMLSKISNKTKEELEFKTSPLLKLNNKIIVTLPDF